MTSEMQKANLDGGSKNTIRRTCAPAVDIQELADAFVVRLEMPGAEKESIAASVSGSTLTVTGTSPAYFSEGATLLYDDSIPVEYRREFSLAENIDSQSVDAAYDLGVLKITLKKKQQFLPKEIKIQ